MISKRQLLSAGAAAAALKFGSARAAAETIQPNFSEARAIAEAGFIYGLPIVMNYAVMYQFCIDKTSDQYKGPFNQIVNEDRVFTYKDTAVVTPNSDTPYSFIWMDLRAEPIILEVPPVDSKRYYSIQLCDGNTYNYGYIGSRATKDAAGSYMVAGPNWNGPTPAGVKQVFRSSTEFSVAIYRTQLFDADDMPNVAKIQAGYKAQPLCAFLKQPAPPAPPAIAFPLINAKLVKKNFFEFLDFALQFAPAQPAETEIRARLAQIGVGPGKKFQFKDLSLKAKLEVGLGMAEGDKKVDAEAAAIGTGINGWRISAPFGDGPFFNGNWLLRAAAAKAGIYGNSADEAMYPQTRVDSQGRTLDGAEHNYTLTFAAGELPPVNAFWSVTMYDGKSQLLIENPINRYLINSPMLPAMKTNPDGSLTLYIQNESPGADKEPNWLPAPKDSIYLVMRLYWPKTTPPSILPAGQGSWKPPAVIRVS
jgi:hypothetical protein